MSARLASDPSSSPGLVRRSAAAILWASWTAIRLPCLAVLIVLEPVVRLVFAGSALLIVLAAFFFACVRPHTAPFWGMLGVAVGAVFILALYYALLRLLSA
jgi:hypothetical protein